jgi:hypothetical protein
VPGLHGLTEAINDQLRPSLPPASAQLVEDWRAGRFDDLDPEGLIDENSIFYAHVDAANLGRLLSVDDVDQRWLSSFSMRVRFEHGHGRLLLVEQRYRGRQVVSGLRFRAD